jgi:methylated-DNA-[protein]-cysteine S-methyltransferase
MLCKVNKAFASSFEIRYLKMSLAYLNSPIGMIEIVEKDGEISSIQFVEEKLEKEEISEIVALARSELQSYFNGELKTFSFLMHQIGTHFQQDVWGHLKAIPFGHQISYTTLAVRMNNLAAIRAIAASNGKNKILIAIPCHRVIGMSGDLTGYAGGIWRKKWIINHESKIAGIGQAVLNF